MLTIILLVKTLQKQILLCFSKNKSLINLLEYPYPSSSDFKVFLDSFKSNIHESNPFINTLFFKVEFNCLNFSKEIFSLESNFQSLVGPWILKEKSFSRIFDNIELHRYSILNTLLWNCYGLIKHFFPFLFWRFIKILNF